MLSVGSHCCFFSEENITTGRLIISGTFLMWKGYEPLVLQFLKSFLERFTLVYISILKGDSGSDSAYSEPWLVVYDSWRSTNKHNIILKCLVSFCLVNESSSSNAFFFFFLVFDTLKTNFWDRQTYTAEMDYHLGFISPAFSHCQTFCSVTKTDDEN